MKRARGATPILALSALLVALSGSDSFAAGQERGPASRRGGARAESLEAGTYSRAQELRKRIEELRHRRMVEYLRLTDAQAGMLEERLDMLSRQQDGTREDRERLLAELRREVENAPPREAGLRDKLERLRRNREARERALQEFHDALARELSVEQQARLQLFADRFHSRMAERLRHLRARRGTAPP